jgi:hypothetical protein
MLRYFDLFGCRSAVPPSALRDIDRHLLKDIGLEHLYRGGSTGSHRPTDW